MATDKIVAEYTVKVDAALKNLDKLANKVDKIDDERKKTQAGFKDMSSSLASSFSKVGAAIGLAFSTQQLVSFGKEAVQLAAKTEGVERAFRRISSKGLLNDLRTATRGTVTDLQLMQRAVQASNFKLPLEQLAGLLKFASARARETGEDVDYLVNSIVLGIGRKSPLILDNLGISAVELRTRLKGVGVEATSVADIAKIVGDIASEELEKMGEQADTSADQIAQIGVAFENMQVKAGKAINDVANKLVKLGEKQGIIESDTPFRKQIELTMEYATAVRNAATEIKKDRESEIKALEQVNDKDAAIQKLKENRINILKELETELAKITSTETRKSENLKLLFAEKALENAVGFDVFQREAAKERIKEAKEEIKANVIKEGVLNSQISALIKILGLQKDIDDDEVVKETIKNLFYYNELISKLQEDQKDANITRAEVRRLEREINDAIRERLILLGRLREVGGATYEEIPSFHITEIEAQQQATDDIIADYKYRNGEIEKAMKKRNDMLQEYNEAQRQQELQTALEITEQSLSTLSNLVSSISQIQQNAFTKEQQLLNEQLDQGLITREEFEVKEREIRRKQAASAKDAAIFQAVISTAQAVMQALANTPPPASYALAAVAGALGAAQIAAIASQPLPKFAEGGWVDSKGLIHGKPHSQGGVKIEAEGNEYITKGKYAKPNAAILEAINTGNWERYKMENIITPAIEQVLSGGMENMGASYMLQNQFNDRNLLRAFDRNRMSEKEGFVYLGKKIESLKSKGSRWN